jgi:acetoin:2,6-dichlorophenolindophenol oxidoreductase subunit alpha
MAATVSSSRLQRLLSLYRTMARIRAFENAAEEASKGGVAAFGAALHLSTGQEAVPAGVCANLARTDLITSTHRGHGHTIAKGADVTAMMCELFGRSSGCNGGKGGSMHIADFSVGMLGANGVVAAGIPIAAGAAHAIKLRGGREIVACFFGDGAVNRGPFLEGLNWAQIGAPRIPAGYSKPLEDEARITADRILAALVALADAGARRQTATRG